MKSVKTFLALTVAWIIFSFENASNDKCFKKLKKFSNAFAIKQPSMPK